VPAVNTRNNSKINDLTHKETAVKFFGAKHDVEISIPGYFNNVFCFSFTDVV
jgi:hypothetical protein